MKGEEKKQATALKKRGGWGAEISGSGVA